MPSLTAATRAAERAADAATHAPAADATATTDSAAAALAAAAVVAYRTAATRRAGCRWCDGRVPCMCHRREHSNHHRGGTRHGLLTPTLALILSHQTPIPTLTLGLSQPVCLFPFLALSPTHHQAPVTGYWPPDDPYGLVLNEKPLPWLEAEAHCVELGDHHATNPNPNPNPNPIPKPDPISNPGPNPNQAATWRPSTP